MSDPMVLKSQQWLNQTYGNVSGYGNKISEDGYTGWETINALIRALQIELGITNTANNFGPSTISLFVQRFPNGIQQQAENDQTEDNIYAIIQCACWCKGYSTGEYQITRHFNSRMGESIRELKTDAGSSEMSSIVTLNVMKALLSMDQFRLVSGGSEKIQQIQRELNFGYESYIGLSPCDGIYARQMNESMIKVLQAIEGYSVADATGNFGAGTKANLPIVPSEGKLNNIVEEAAIKLVRYTLYCNGYDIAINSSIWDTDLKDRIKEFQNDMCIEQSGICDVDTWMALLLSKGNPDRSCIACDTRFVMTEDNLNYLISNDYQIIGRYVTGGDYKELAEGESKRIIDKGLKLFPIFQESGTDLTYFTSARGKIDAKKAVKGARKHGIPAGNIIYFAVDTDPTNAQILTYILPYFQAISENIDYSYKVGVYGTRNVCTQVMNNGYAETCFVSDMSTGFSGNMGYKMPSNWNFDQFNEIDVHINGRTIDLDKVAYSGKFPAVTEVYDTLKNYNSKIATLEDLYVKYKESKAETCTRLQLILGITNFLRSFKYREYIWFATTLTAIDDEFIQFVKVQNPNLYVELYNYASTDEKALCDEFGGFTDIGHLCATIEGYFAPTTAPDFWFGWGGDLATMMRKVNERYNKGEGTYLDIANKIIGRAGSGFAYPDMCSDADAIKIVDMLKNSTSNNHPVSEAIAEYLENNMKLRISYYLMDLEDVSLDLSVHNLKNSIIKKMSGTFESTILIPFLGQSFNEELKNACCEAFAQYIIDNYPTT